MRKRFSTMVGNSNALKPQQPPLELASNIRHHLRANAANLAGEPRKPRRRKHPEEMEERWAPEPCLLPSCPKRRRWNSTLAEFWRKLKMPTQKMVQYYKQFCRMNLIPYPLYRKKQ